MAAFRLLDVLVIQTTDWCRICTLPTAGNKRQSGRYAIHCPQCGEYILGELPAQPFDWSREQVANGSGYLRAHGTYRLLAAADVEFLENLRTPTVADKAEKLLHALAKLCPVAGQEIVLPSFLSLDQAQHAYRPNRSATKYVGLDLEGLEKKFRWLSWAWVQSEEELLYLVFDYLRDAVGYVAGERLQGTPDKHTAAVIKVTPAGWRFLQSGPSLSQFISVTTAPKLRMETVWTQAIQPAIEEAGYLPLRGVRGDEGGIADEAIVQIRRSRLLVADFTWARETAYYEAGLAAGLGIPVVWMVREHQEQETRADLGRFDPLIWSEQDLPTLRERLQTRIEAIPGRGNRRRRS